MDIVGRFLDRLLPSREPRVGHDLDLVDDHVPFKELNPETPHRRTLQSMQSMQPLHSFQLGFGFGHAYEGAEPSPSRQ